MNIEDIFIRYPWFVLSHSSLRLWLNTRKLNIPGGLQVSVPGLFQTYWFFWDSFFFIIVLILEVLGLLFFYIYFGSLFFAVLFFSLDFIFATGCHWNKARWTELKIELSLLNSNKFLKFAEDKDYINGEQKPIEHRIKWRRKIIRHFKIYRIVFACLLFYVLFMKTSGFVNGWTDSGMSSLGIPLIIISSYIIVNLIHLFSTGYFGSEIIFRLRLRREIREHISYKRFCNPGISFFPSQPFLQIQIPNPNNLTFPGPPDNRLQNNDQQFTPKFPRPHIIHDLHQIEYNTLSTCGILLDSQKYYLLQRIHDPDPNVRSQKRDAFLSYATYHQLMNIMEITPFHGFSLNTDLPEIPQPPSPLGPVPEQ
ncbi:MAG: hypothetical protein NTX61_07270 [Bacteroidetes bacterium]|nr:hypothetical protein [Bacteroidota bacterium]